MSTPESFQNSVYCHQAQPPRTTTPLPTRPAARSLLGMGSPSHEDVPGGASGKAVGCIVIFQGGNITALKPHNLLPHPAGTQGVGEATPAPAPGSAAAS